MMCYLIGSHFTRAARRNHPLAQYMDEWKERKVIHLAAFHLLVTVMFVPQEINSSWTSSFLIWPPKWLTGMQTPTLPRGVSSESESGRNSQTPNAAGKAGGTTVAKEEESSAVPRQWSYTAWREGHGTAEQPRKSNDWGSGKLINSSASLKAQLCNDFFHFYPSSISISKVYYEYLACSHKYCYWYASKDWNSRRESAIHLSVWHSHPSRAMWDLFFCKIFVGEFIRIKS